VSEPSRAATTTAEIEVPRASVTATLSLIWGGLKALVKQPFYALYERRLATQVSTWNLPRHIGIIMDGNRRFARGLGRSHVLFGHSRGAEKLREVLRWCQECEIPVVTVWSFSLDNFARADSEVDDLLRLFEERTRELIDGPDVHENGIRVRYIGKTDLLPESLRQAIAEIEHITRDYDKFHLNIAMAYGGRQEITDAFKQYLTDRADEGATLNEVADEVDEDCIERYLYTSGQPEPDLILRTSGEIRAGLPAHRPVPRAARVQPAATTTGPLTNGPLTGD